MKLRRIPLACNIIWETKTMVLACDANWAEPLTKLQKYYVLWSPSPFVVVVLPPDRTLGCYSIVLCFDMRIQGRVWQIWSIACTTSILSPLFITSRFSCFLLFLLRCFGVFRIIFYVKVVNHIHCLHRALTNHFCLSLVILLCDWEKLSIVFLLDDVSFLFCWEVGHSIETNWRHFQNDYYN